MSGVDHGRALEIAERHQNHRRGWLANDVVAILARAYLESQEDLEAAREREREAMRRAVEYGGKHEGLCVYCGIWYDDHYPDNCWVADYEARLKEG